MGMNKNFIKIIDHSKENLTKILDFSIDLKAKASQGYFPRLLDRKGLAMFFEKPSNRTRVSFDVAINQLGGYAINLEPTSIQLGGRESIADVARTLSRFVDVIMMRTFSHQLVEDIGQYATVPVINGLTDFNHPCQVMADIMTIEEYKGRSSDFVLAYVGDGNNVLNSLISAAVRFGFTLRAACPPGYKPDPTVVNVAQTAVGKDRVQIFDSPPEAASQADVIYTDVWTSMGKEDEKAVRLDVFAPYQVNSALVAQAKSDVIVMHCLPAHRGEEITDEVIDGPRSVVFDQAENRLHVQKAILVYLLNGI